MIGEHLNNPLPFTNASAISGPIPVRLNPSANRSVVAAATNNVEIQGFVSDASYAAGEAVTVYGDGDVVEAIAGASLGAGADIGIASTNGALGPVAGASGTARYRVGRSLESAAAGERFSVLVKPGQLSGLS
jgi:hypothetical protein